MCATNKDKQAWPVLLHIKLIISLFYVFTLQIFTRILRSLNLPVGTGPMMVPRYLTVAYDISHVVLWVSSLLVRPQITTYYGIFTAFTVLHDLSGFNFVNFREDPVSRLKHSSVAFLTASRLSSTHLITAGGWWVISCLTVCLNDPIRTLVSSIRLTIKIVPM